MKLLLDTHIWLWSHLEPRRLGRSVARHLEDPGNELWLSSVSAWETLLLAERGRLELSPSPETWIERRLAAVPIRDAAVTRDVAMMSRAVGLAHEDPADRFIAATAVVYDLTLVTADDQLQTSTRYRVMANR